jgi:hypothetical protein
MKKHSINSSSSLIVLSTLVVLLFGATAQAQILLEVNDSDPSSVVITATGAAPSTPVADGYPIYDGIDLSGFFTGNQGTTFYTVASSTLVAASSPTLLFDQAAADSDMVTNSQTALSLFGDSGSISFPAGQPAFAGTLTLNLSGTSIQGGGVKGEIFAGSSQGGPQTVIGEWEIVSPVAAPEPSTWMLLAGSVALLPFLRRLRRS